MPCGAVSDTAGSARARGVRRTHRSPRGRRLRHRCRRPHCLDHSVLVFRQQLQTLARAAGGGSGTLDGMVFVVVPVESQSRNLRPVRQKLERGLTGLSGGRDFNGRVADIDARARRTVKRADGDHRADRAKRQSRRSRTGLACGRVTATSGLPAVRTGPGPAEATGRRKRSYPEEVPVTEATPGAEGSKSEAVTQATANRNTVDEEAGAATEPAAETPTEGVRP